MEPPESSYRIVAEFRGSAMIVYLGNERVDVRADLRIYGQVPAGGGPATMFDLRGRIWRPDEPQFAMRRMDQRGILEAGGWRVRVYVSGRGGELALAGPILPPESFYDAPQNEYERGEE